MYQIDLQILMSFAKAFANGFVLEKRTQIGGSVGSFSLKSGFVLPRKLPRGASVAPATSPSRSQCCAPLAALGGVCYVGATIAAEGWLEWSEGVVCQTAVTRTD